MKLKEYPPDNEDKAVVINQKEQIFNHKGLKSMKIRLRRTG